jgi:uncharacterized protein (DUF1501 family)
VLFWELATGAGSSYQNASLNHEEKTMDHYHNDTIGSADSITEAIKGSPVTRRWLLRNSANAAAGVVAATAFGATATRLDVQPVAAAAEIGEHADKPAGYVHSLHGWDTI